MKKEAYKVKDNCGGMGCKKHPNIKCWDCPEPDCIAQGNDMISRKQTKKKEGGLLNGRG